MSHIVEFEVEGLAGRDDVYAKKLNPDINVFFGVNGSGKTSLLTILHSAMERESGVLLNVPFRRATVTVYSIKHERNFEYSIEKPESVSTFVRDLPPSTTLEEIPEAAFPDEESMKRFRWSFSPEEPDEVGARWQHRYLPATRLISGVFRGQAWYPEHPRREEEIHTAIEQELLSQWREYFGDVQTNVRGVQQSGLAAILKTVLAQRAPSQGKQQLGWQEAYDLAESFLRRTDPRAHLESKERFSKRFPKDATLRGVISHIRDIEDRIAHVLAPRDNLEALINNLFHRKRLDLGSTIEVVAGTDRQIRLAQLSSGEKQVLYILIQTLRAGVSALLIDEPELSMHIEWQNSLIAGMRQLNPECQLIIATHSPEIMADLDETRIFRL